MIVAVTGANGLVGAHLTRALINENHTVLAISRSTEPAVLTGIAGNERYTYRNIDIGDEDCMAAALRVFAVETVFHCAVQRIPPTETGTVETGSAWNCNVNGTATVMRAAHRSAVRAFIHSSAMMVYDLDAHPQWAPDETVLPCPGEPNGLTVAVAEQMVGYLSRRLKLPSVILRYPGLYGPGKTGGFVAGCIAQMLRTPQKPVEVRSNRRADFLWVGDVVTANLIVAMKLNELHGRLFHIGSGHSWSVRDIATKLRGIIGCQTPLEEATPLPDRDFRLDCTRAINEIGYSPKPLDYGLDQTVQEWRKTIQPPCTERGA